MHNVTILEAETMFFDHIRAIFKEHELRLLQSFLRDYRSIISRYGFPTSGVQSSYIKDILIREFEGKIGFQSRLQRNHSELVYDTSGGGSCFKAALSSICVSSEQLVCNVAQWLRDDIKSIKLISWPMRVEELEKEEELSPLWCSSYLLWGRKGDRSVSKHTCSHLAHRTVHHKTAYHYCH